MSVLYSFFVQCFFLFGIWFHHFLFWYYFHAYFILCHFVLLFCIKKNFLRWYRFCIYLANFYNPLFFIFEIDWFLCLFYCDIVEYYYLVWTIDCMITGILSIYPNIIIYTNNNTVTFLNFPNLDNLTIIKSCKRI